MEFLAFPSGPEGDEIVVQRGDIFERGSKLMVERLKQLSSDTNMPFEIERLQVSHFAQHPLIVRAHVQWTQQAHTFRSREMVRIDSDGYPHSCGELLS